MTKSSNPKHHFSIATQLINFVLVFGMNPRLLLIVLFGEKGRSRCGGMLEGHDETNFLNDAKGFHFSHPLFQLHLVLKQFGIVEMWRYSKKVFYAVIK